MDQENKKPGIVIVQGGSMRPFLKQGDMLTMVPEKMEDIHIGDIVICRFKDGFSARRIFKKWEDSVDLGADTRLEGINVKREALLGKVVERKRKEISTGCQSPRWVFYAQIVILNYSIRGITKKACHCIVDILKRTCALMADILKRCFGQKRYYYFRNLIANVIKKLPAGFVRRLRDIIY